MLETIPYPSEEALERLERISSRKMGADPEIEKQVVEILEAVRREGDEAVLRYARKFDSPGLRLDRLTVGEEEIEEAFRQIEPQFLEILRAAATNIEEFHRPQLRPSSFTAKPDGTFLGQVIRAVDAAGLYIPGGRSGETPLISSVLMNAIPARLAGVRDIALTTPPRRDGSINPHLLAAARQAGVTRIHRAGSAWAIAALAFGTASIRKVDVIVGPGNIYVALAKKIVSGEVGIDMLAGPSEILVIGDQSADPECVAADLLGQAEHDSMASAVLIALDESLAAETAACLERRIELLPRRDTASKALNRYGAIFLVESPDDALGLANAMAPEHLELQVSDPWSWIGKIRHAGAIFLGGSSPEAVGDYFAGPNHVLPTAGTARFASALGVENFQKKTSIISYSRAALERDATSIIRLAELEGLEAHAASIRVRVKAADNR